MTSKQRLELELSLRRIFSMGQDYREQRGKDTATGQGEAALTMMAFEQLVRHTLTEFDKAIAARANVLSSFQREHLGEPYAAPQAMTREEFAATHIPPGMTREQFEQTFDVVPCACDYGRCKGWQVRIKGMRPDARIDARGAQAMMYECTGCGRRAEDPQADYAELRKAGHVSCCPERHMVPWVEVWRWHAADWLRDKAQQADFDMPNGAGYLRMLAQQVLHEAGPAVVEAQVEVVGGSSAGAGAAAAPLADAPADHIRRLAEDYADACVRAGYVTTIQCPEWHRLTAAIAAPAPAVAPEHPAVAALTAARDALKVMDPRPPCWAADIAARDKALLLIDAALAQGSLP